MIILWNIGKSAITFQFKKHIKEKLSVSSKQFPQSVKISADSVRVSTPFLMSDPWYLLVLIIDSTKEVFILLISYYKTKPALLYFISINLKTNDDITSTLTYNRTRGMGDPTLSKG